MAGPVVTIKGLRKSYGSVEAVRGIDLQVEEGEIFAFLGPNGAGKTTTVEILEGYRNRTAGEVQVLGVDPAHGDRLWTSRIGVMLQSWQVEPDLTVRESLEQFAGYYPRPRAIDEIEALVGLSDQSGMRAGRLSGGQQRRLDMGLALIGDPELLFLDEPTTGFDPVARRAAWEIVASLRDEGKTVFLTTHYMDEAEFLADRVAIIANGEIRAEGSPDSLAGSRARITFRLPPGVGTSELPTAAGRPIEIADGRIELQADSLLLALSALTSWAIARGLDLPDLEVRRRRLEDVYLELNAAT